jgi:hypothetical protein
MKKILLLTALSTLLLTVGFGQTPVATIAGDPASIKGCLGGAEGNYTVAENGTKQTFRISSSTVNLQPHVGHDVELIGQKGSADPAAADNSIAVTKLNMIGEHCVAAPTSMATPPDAAPMTTATTTSTTTTTTPATTPAEPASAPIAATSTPVATTTAPVPPDTTPTTTTSTAPTMPIETTRAPTNISTTTAAESTERLPETASSLPLIMLLGLGMLAMGMLTTFLMNKRPLTV